MLILNLLPALEKRRGSITPVSSVIAHKAVPHASLYAASKGAVDVFTCTLAKELAPRGIRVNAVAPGAISTPIFTKIGLPQDELQVMETAQEKNIPMARDGEPDEVAQVILAREESS